MKKRRFLPGAYLGERRLVPLFSVRFPRVFPDGSFLMTHGGLCPVCSAPMPDSDPRRKWCSQKCRQKVYEIGGPLNLARRKEVDADRWAFYAESHFMGGSEEARAEKRRRAKKLRREAKALRLLVQGSS